MNNLVTSDLADFGQRELELGFELLKAYSESRPDYLGENTMLKFNTQSGNVFLSDEDNNIGMMDGQELKRWAVCCMCGREGFADERDEDNRKVFLDPLVCDECVENAACEELT